MSRRASETRAPIADAFLDEMFCAILDGTHPPGARLGTERELALRWSTSRVTVRQMLQRLVDLRVITVKRGSGSTVRPRRDWSFRALPIALRCAARIQDFELLAAIVRDGLLLRRELVVTIARQAAPRLRGAPLKRARAALAAAWTSRHDAEGFAHHDTEIMRSMADDAGMFAAAWLLNDIADAYAEGIKLVWPVFEVADDYLERNTRLLDAIAAGDATGAIDEMQAHFAALDARILVALGL